MALLFGKEKIKILVKVIARLTIISKFPVTAKQRTTVVMSTKKILPFFFFDE